MSLQYGQDLLPMDVDEFRQSPHAEELTMLIPISMQLEQHSKRSHSPKKPISSRRSRSRTPRAYDENDDDDQRDKEKKTMDLDDATKSDLDTSQKETKSTYSMHVAGLIAKTIKNWVRKVKSRDNETWVRNTYYKIMMELIFSKSHPFSYFFSLIDRIHFIPKDSTSKSVCFTGFIRPRLRSPVKVLVSRLLSESNTAGSY